MTREEAKAAGEKFYQGEPCVKCEATTRYTKGGRCVACMKVDDQLPERKAKKKAKEQTPECKARRKAKEQTPERKAQRKAHDQTPKRKANMLRKTAKSRANNKHIVCTLNNEDVLRLLLVAEEQWREMGIEFDYTVGNGLGRQKPFGPSLDQIVPGKGYTLENIQIVPFFWNVFRGAHFTERQAMEVILKIAIFFCKQSPKIRQRVLDEISLANDVPAS
jgi:hypothetical protein